MQISRNDIVAHYQEAGRDAEAQRAAAELPDQIDVEDEQGLLASFDVDPKQLLGQMGSGVGDVS